MKNNKLVGVFLGAIIGFVFAIAIVSPLSSNTTNTSDTKKKCAICSYDCNFYFPTMYIFLTNSK